MKKIIIIIIVFGLCYFIYKNILYKDNHAQLTTNGSDIVIKNGDNKFIGEIVSDYKEDLRIYGINNNNEQGWSPVAYATFIFVAGPLRGNAEDCERNDASNAPLVNIIVENSEIRDKINKLKNVEDRRSAALVGRKVHIKEFIYKNENHTNALRTQGKLDPSNAIIIDDIVLLK